MDGRRKNYRPWDPQQYELDPVSPREALPENDLVFFVIDLIPPLDLTPFHEYYSEQNVLGAFVASSVESVWGPSMLAISLPRLKATCGAGSCGRSCATRGSRLLRAVCSPSPGPGAP